MNREPNTTQVEHDEFARRRRVRARIIGMLFLFPGVAMLIYVAAEQLALMFGR